MRAHIRAAMFTTILLIAGLAISAPLFTARAATNNQIRIGYIVKTLGNPFWQKYKDGAEAAGQKLGVSVTVRDVPTEGDFKAQLDVAKTMVSQNYTALVAASITNTNLIPAIAAANKKKIPWVVVSEDQDPAVLAKMNATVTTKCRLSFYDEGVLIGKFVATRLDGKGEVGIVAGMAGTSATTDRIQGIKDVFKDYPNLKIVSTQPGDWQREKAHDIAVNMLHANPGLGAIIANNDDMALGATAAVKQAGKEGKVLVTGDDGTDQAYQAIKDGSLAATIDGLPWLIAYYSVFAATKAVVEKANTLPNLSLHPFLVTKDNVDDVLKLSPRPTQAAFDENKNIYTPIPGYPTN